MKQKFKNKDNVTEFPTKKVDEEFKEEAVKEKEDIKEFNIKVINGVWNVKPEGKWTIDEIYNVLTDVKEVYNNKRIKLLCESLVMNTIINMQKANKKEGDDDSN